MESATATSTEPLELREIPGPSAFGGGWRRTWDMLWLTSVTEFRLQYSEHDAGLRVERPQAIRLLRDHLPRHRSGAESRFSRDVADYPHKLILALVFFQYFSEATNVAMRSISARESMLRKTQFPRIVIPLSVNLSAALTLFFNLSACSCC